MVRERAAERGGGAVPSAPAWYARTLISPQQPSAAVLLRLDALCCTVLVPKGIVQWGRAQRAAVCKDQPARVELSKYDVGVSSLVSSLALGSVVGDV